MFFGVYKKEKNTKKKLLGGLLLSAVFAISVVGCAANKYSSDKSPGGATYQRAKTSGKSSLCENKYTHQLTDCMNNAKGDHQKLKECMAKFDEEVNKHCDN
jgi:hypothetical protein